MGRNFSDERDLIPSTLAWARSLDVAKWADTLTKLRHKSLIVVASGGSFGAAQLIAQLHGDHRGPLAVAMTPLDFIATVTHTDAAIWFLSASGSNQEILHAWRTARAMEVRDVVVMCGTVDSLLVKEVKAHGISLPMTFDIPAGRDGFLATNSLAAFTALALRLYGHEVPEIDLAASPKVPAAFYDRPTWIVLYGGWMKPVALDLESRFHEAAMGVVLITDYRNFAHGRHYWLALHGATTGVLALVTPRFAQLASDTLRELPEEILTARWDWPEDAPQSVLEGIIASMQVAGDAATRKGYDAGRPGVPPFGERIYTLKTAIASSAVRDRRATAVDRKLRACSSRSPVDCDDIATALEAFESQLTSTQVSGIVFDYDGTLVATPERFGAMRPEVSAALSAVLDSGIRIGIATGRGKSCHKHLRAAIGKRYWSQIILGYYNGGVIRALSDPCDDLKVGEKDSDLVRANSALGKLRELRGPDVLDLRPTQLTITRPGFREHGLWLTVRQVLDRLDLHTLKVTHSSHSVDVMPRSVSKRAVVERLASELGVSEDAILKIGDRGSWPGNDHELLSMAHGLSVDEVSSDANSCWNLLPQGVTGHHGTLWYLRHLRDGRLQLPAS
ncbi:HAD-IIB family hydrolase [Nevskia ramosa]|uniref:HAD-IIB family hydrolase n=1 Tax=Nevskia ramosa TaxID=64002 RepID=UPI002355F846|nr:HAD-IIB family hydrolase [Nevskia ramosa]